MYHLLQQLFSRSIHIARRRRNRRQIKLSFDTAAGHELEPRRLLAVAPLPMGLMPAQQSSAAYVSTASAPLAVTAISQAPRIPQGFSAVPGDGQANLSWKPPVSDGGTRITNYLVQYRTGADPNWTSLNRDPSEPLTALVTGLTNGTSYTFRVAAANAQGTSAFAYRYETPGTVPTAPGSMVALGGNGKVVLTWARPSADGGRPIIDYRIFVSNDGGTNWNPVQRVASLSTQAEVRGLQNSTAYSFKVAAINQLGVGYFSNCVGPVTPAATVPATVTRVTSVIGDASITVRWTVPADNGGSEITGYAIQYSADAGRTWNLSEIAQASATLHTVNGLTNGVAYIFRVAAVNDIGRGTFSAPTLPLAPATVPGQPGVINAVAGTGTALLSWVIPSSNGGSPITDFVIQYSTDGGASWSLYPHTPSPSASVTVGGLANGVEHVFRVAAVNSIGAGPYSITSATTIPVAPVTVPGAPSSVTVRVGSGQATLTWSAPTSNGNSVITSYEISYSTKGTQEWSAPQTVPATSSTAVVTNLSNGVAYSFRVVAVNAAGRGSAAIVTDSPTDPTALTTIRFLKAGTLPVTVQFGYTVRDTNGKPQFHYQTVRIGSLDKSASIKVPDFDRIDGTVTVTVTVRNLPNGTTKSQSFKLVKKTNYSMAVSYNTRDRDPWSATTIRCG